MIKHILFILCLVSFPLYAQVGGGVQIDLEAPDHVVAGSNIRKRVEK